MTSVSLRESRMVFTNAIRKNKMTMGMKRPENAVSFWACCSTAVTMAFKVSEARRDEPSGGTGSLAEVWAAARMLDGRFWSQRGRHDIALARRQALLLPGTRGAGWAMRWNPVRDEWGGISIMSIISIRASVAWTNIVILTVKIRDRC